MEEGRELTDEELEQVIGGATRESFLNWAAHFFTLHLFEQQEDNDEQTNK